MTSSPALFDALREAISGSASPAAADAYLRRHVETLAQADVFWSKEGRRLRWSRAYSRTWEDLAAPAGASASRAWFPDGRINAAFNCIDRHLPHKADAPALLIDTGGPGPMRVVTYSELYSGVCRMANVLKAQRVGIGETVALDLPPSPEAVCALLACARIGAVATSVDAATTPAALAIRLQETRARVILSDDSKVARADLPDTLTSVVWIGPPDAAPASARTVQYSLAAEGVSDECEPEDTAARDPLAALDDPHGRIATGGFLVWSLVTHETLFATGPGTITCCTAPTISPIWLAHGVLGPLLHGGTIFLTSATGARLRQTCDTHGVSTLCAPASGLGDAVPATDTRRPTRLVAVMDHAPTRGSQASHATRLPQDAIRTLEVPGAGLFATVTGSSIVLPMPGVGIDLDSGSAPAGAGPAEGWVSLRHWPGAIDKAVHPLPSEFRWLARRDSEGRIGLSPA